MSLLFARIELRGTPGDEIYSRLHAFMESRNWLRTITGTTATVQLPHGTYQAVFSIDAPDTMAIAQSLKRDIEANIWSRALVLVIRSAHWAQTAG
jgi:hypothetical protein